MTIISTKVLNFFQVMLLSLAESVESSQILWHLAYVSILVLIVLHQYMEARIYTCLRGYFSVSGFLDFSTTDILCWIILCSGGCPVHCNMFLSIPGLYPLAISTLS